MAEVHPWYVLMDVTSQGPPGSLHGAAGRCPGRRAGSRPRPRCADRRVRRPGRAALEDAREPGRGPGGGRRQHRPRRVRAGVPHPGIHRARRCRRGRRPVPASAAAPSATSATATCTTTRSSRWIGTGRALSRAAPAHQPYRARHRRRPRGSISAEHGVGRSRLAELEHYKQPIELDMMRSLKRALDPSGIMNPGKILRG